MGQFIFEALDAAGQHPLQLPSAIVNPATPQYRTRAEIQKALDAWGSLRPSFFHKSADELWSDRVRSACNLCGFCGEYLCWGKDGPKSGSRVTTIRELKDLQNVEIITNAKAYEVVYDEKTKLATGVRYLDTSKPDSPKPCERQANHVIVSCGAVQSARLLLLSGPPGGLGNSSGLVGRHAMFHLFGMGATAWLPDGFQGLLRSELGHTGNVTSFETYFVPDTLGSWWKGGTLASAAFKNPLENADGKMSQMIGLDLLKELERYPRQLQLRLTFDDLPMPKNRVDLDPTYVDEHGLPVARVTRDLGPAENQIYTLMQPRMKQIFQRFIDAGILKDDPKATNGFSMSPAIPTLIGDHQMGTCRMGDDRAASVLDRFCRMHDVRNVLVVDSSFMPTGLGLNPMVTVVANALRVGAWIVEEMNQKGGLV